MILMYQHMPSCFGKCSKLSVFVDLLVLIGDSKGIVFKKLYNLQGVFLLVNCHCLEWLWKGGPVR